MGRKPIAKTTFASAYQKRDYRIFEDFAFYMMEQVRKKRVTDIFKLKGNVYAFDSTTIPLCLSVFWWAKFRKKKGGVKAHVLYDLKSQVSAFFQSLQHPFTTQKQWRKFLMNQVLTMFSTVDTMHSRNFSKYICMNRSLLCEPRKICNTNAVNGSADCQKYINRCRAWNHWIQFIPEVSGDTQTRLILWWRTKKGVYLPDKCFSSNSSWNRQPLQE